MSPLSLRQRLKAAIKARLGATLDPSGATGELSLREHEAVFALFQVITADPEFPFDEYRRFVDRQTREVPGALDAYRRSVALLDRMARGTVEGEGPRFALLPGRERDRVLRRLFRPYPHAERQLALRRLSRLTSRNIRLLVDAGARRSLRHHVMRGLLAFYYSTAEGWAVVGWAEFPGKASQG
jgi:hypothetical protein